MKEEEKLIVKQNSRRKRKKVEGRGNIQDSGGNQTNSTYYSIPVLARARIHRCTTMQIFCLWSVGALSHHRGHFHDDDAAAMYGKHQIVDASKTASSSLHTHTWCDGIGRRRRMDDGEGDDDACLQLIQTIATASFSKSLYIKVKNPQGLQCFEGRFRNTHLFPFIITSLQ